MKLKKLICVSLICILSASMIVGCNGNDTANDGKVQLEVGNWPDGDVEKENAAKYEAYKIHILILKSRMETPTVMTPPLLM